MIKTRTSASRQLLATVVAAAVFSCGPTVTERPERPGGADSAAAETPIVRDTVKVSAALFADDSVIVAPGTDAGETRTRTDIPYALDRPSAAFRLDKRLREISGLATIDDTTLAAVQDELGVLFFLDARNGGVLRSVKFAGRGDYEGVERVRDTLYVLRSDGDLYVVQHWDTDRPDALKIETRLKSKNDTEGLGFDLEAGRLLIAAKEDPGKVSDKMKALFAYWPERRSVDEEPAMLIDTREFASGDGAVSRTVRTILPRASRFKPSGVAVHPYSNQIYVISSVRQVLAVFHRNGTLAAIGDLEGAGLRQPEGITFLPNGDLMVASEGGERGRLVRFAYLDTVDP